MNKMLAILLCAMLCTPALATNPTSQGLPHMSPADARFYGIAPCVHAPCVSFIIYTISFCYGAPGEKRCSAVRARPFEYTSADDCAAQVNTMTPGAGVGWYECEPNIVSQQGVAHTHAGPDAPVRSYAMFLCKIGGCGRPISDPIFPTRAICLSTIVKVGGSRYIIQNDRIYAKGENSAWYECRKVAK